MIVYILGILDILAGLSLFFSLFGVGLPILGFFAIYLFVKSLCFIRSISSWIDLAVVIVIIISIFGHTDNLTYVSIIWLLQKGIFSFF